MTFLKTLMPSQSSVNLRPSSETQGQIVGARESLNGRKNFGTKKSKERREEPLRTMSYQTSSKRSPPFCLLIGQKNSKVFWHRSEVRTAFFTFLLAIFSRPFRLSLAPSICPWVSEDDLRPPPFEFYLKTADLAARQHISRAQSLPQGAGFGSFFTENL